MNFVSGLMIAMNSKNKENSKKLSVQKRTKGPIYCYLSKAEY